jgi:hypothetical protein
MRRSAVERDIVEDEILRTLIRSLSHAPARVTGRVLATSASGAFTLVTADGIEVNAAAREALPIKQLGRLLGLEVEAFGTGLFAPTGRMVLFLADGYLPHSTVQPKSGRLPGSLPEERAAMAERLKGVIGTWPGANTDEEEKTAAEVQN